MHKLIVALLALTMLAGCTSDETDDTVPEPVETTPELMPEAPEWGNPDDAVLRPGINMAYDGASCTTSFLFQENWERFFLATAAHCVSDGNGCDGETTLPEGDVELSLLDGSTATATVAYHAWATMNDLNETDANACAYNDFAFIELNPADVNRTHPASRHFMAPTNMSVDALSQGDNVWGYGASILKQGVSESHPKQGAYLGLDYDGWQHHVYLGTPGIPGDSGGHIMTADGKALGIASTVTLAPTPGSNHYTDIAKSVAYMEEALGWAPELVTWDDFNASVTPVV